MDFLHLDIESVEVWPCLSEERLGDWRLRFGAGAYGRSNSVQPYGSPGLPLEEAIAYCEHAYRAQALIPTFRLPTFLDPALESILARRGYATQDSTHVQVASLDQPWEPREVEYSTDPSPEWLEAYLGYSGRDPLFAATIHEIQRRIPAPRAYIGIRSGEQLASVGVGSIYRGTLWIFNIATAERFRGQGHASKVSSALMSWGQSEGAERAALQVLATNAPALRLYSKFGFRTAYGYSYRRQLHK